MNIKQIIKESLLLEAIRISTPQDAYELIKSKKLGVKMHPSYNNVDNTESKNMIKSGMDAIISSSKNMNNLVFTVQLIVNKVPIDKMNNYFISCFTCDLVEYRNKPWAKEIPEYKEFIEFNGKEMDPYKMNDLLKEMDKEAQKHGHGDKKEAKTLYDDGTWTLQVPTSYKGAKAISFYGKKGEQQIPTEWCTRASSYQYDNYTQGSPLYIIRNWETGKSYQMSINKKRVDFLDEKDVKGDAIVKGDLRPIPDDLLKKIKYNNKETMLDFKKAISEFEKKKNENISPEEEKRLKKRGYFKDATFELEKARWGKPTKVNNKISKIFFLNYGEIDNKNDYSNPFDSKAFRGSYLPDNINDWKNKTLKNIKGKSGEYAKRNGKLASIYYFNDKPNVGYMLELSSNKEIRDFNIRDGKSKSTTYHAQPVEKKNGKWTKINQLNMSTKLPEYLDLLTVARSDSGADKTNKRTIEKNTRKTEGDIEYLEYVFEEQAAKYIWPILDRKFKFKEKAMLIVKFPKNFLPRSNGGFLPNVITCQVMIRNVESNIIFNILRKDKTLDIKISKHFEAGDFGLDDIKNELEVAAKKTIMAYSKEVIKDKELKNFRINDRYGEGDRLQFENYFPY